MKKFYIHYGQTKLNFSLPEKVVQDVLSVNATIGKSISNQVIQKRLKNFEKQYPSSFYFQNKKVCVLLPDGTRDTPLREGIEIIKPLLTKSAQLRFVIATGSHDPLLEKTLQIREWLQLEFQDSMVDIVDIIIHDAFHDAFIYLGQTNRRTPIYINSQIFGFDTYILLGDLKPHYFAGYSNPLKLLVPGVAAFKTIQANHKMALDLKNHACLHPLHPNPSQRGNDLMDDILEINEIVWKDKNVFVAGVISSHGKIVEFRMGEWKPTIESLLPVVDQYMSQKVLPADISIVSCGGFPLDESLYNAQRALELSMASFKPNSIVIFLAECRNGLGPKKAKSNFYDLMVKPLPVLEKELQQNYILYSHKALRFLKLLTNISALYMVTDLSDELLRPVGIKKLTPNQLQDTLQSLLNNSGTKLKVNIIDDGSKLALSKRN
jgi:nickel-dependent lactate racemase